METIQVRKQDEVENGWRFLVEVGDNEDKIEYSVTLEKEYWEKLTHSASSGQADSRHTPEELVRRSFEFLLEREPKESILKEFNLRVISNYFPEYEKEMRKQMR